VDLQDLAGRAVAVAAHHMSEQRPTEPAATVPDDGTHAFAVTELRRIAYWSLGKYPSLLDALTVQPADLGLRMQATQVLAADLYQYPHLVGPVAAFVTRAWAGPLPVAPSPAAKPFRVGRVRFGWGVLVSVLAVVVVLIGVGTAAVVLRHPTSPTDPVLYQGTVEFGSIDLDLRPPGSGPGMDVQGVAGPGFQLTGNATGAQYEGGSPPTKAMCRQQIAQNGVGGGDISSNLVVDKVSTAMEFCVGTRAGHVVYLRITATTDSTFTAAVTVWGP
jgi:hypothetical protein